MQKLIAQKSIPAYCSGQEFIIIVLRESKPSAIIVKLTITMLPYGTDSISKLPLSMGDLDST